MNKTAIKNFAIWARNKLIAEITYKAGLTGVTADGIKVALPQSGNGIEYYDIGTKEPFAISGEKIKQRQELVAAIHGKQVGSGYESAYKQVIDEVAYTWFNRLIAIRFMEVNNYLPSRIRVLSSVSGKNEPDIVTTPFEAQMEYTDRETEQIIEWKTQEKLDETFRYLFLKQCNELNGVLPALFEKVSDYTELLLTVSFTDKDGVVYHLVHDIPEEDFNVEIGGQVEIIGWLYQYYNTEPKAKVFARASGTKIKKEEIPAATQLFTPDWIVRYMVENSLGRLWVEGHPNDDLKANWKYYLEEAEQEPEVQAQLEKIRKEYAALNPEDLLCIDPCMGSGHILCYFFDVLIQIYESQGYTRRDAAQSILEHNIWGLDIDDRAYQLAYFSVMMKARQYDRRILSRGIQPNVYAIAESNGFNKEQLKYFGATLDESERSKAQEQVNRLLEQLYDAKEYGSILTVDRMDWNLLREFAEQIAIYGQMDMDAIGVEKTQERLRKLIGVGEALAKKYHICCTNPPYMNVSGMSIGLSDYVKKNYADSKGDLYSVFVEKIIGMLRQTGISGLMTSYTWMYLTTYEKFRMLVLKNCTIQSLVQPEYHAFFESANVPICSFVLRNGNTNYKGTYVKLEEFSGAENQPIYYLKAVYDENCEYRFVARQSDFLKIPGVSLAYWLHEKSLSLFEDKLLADYADLKQGLITGDNDRFLRLWQECLMNNITIDISNKKKWFFYHKGGDYRKWYGNICFVVNWEDDGNEIINFRDERGKQKSRPQNVRYYLRQGFTWTALTVADFNVRYMPEGAVFDAKGSSGFCNDELILYYVMGLCNSIVAMEYLSFLAPTMDYNAGAVAKLPTVLSENSKDKVISLVQDNIKLAKSDWDSFETSWDFVTHPLIIFRTGAEYADVPMSQWQYLIKDAYQTWESNAQGKFDLLKSNEEELNRIFIDIYGLQDELTPEVDDKDVTVRKADLQRDIKSLLSYAVGCMFGRYSLDVTGLAYAGGEWDDGKYSTFIPDEDGVIPLTDEEYFDDDIVGLFCAWMKKVYGADTLEKNLDFIARALSSKGNSSREVIRNYFLNDFFKDHCQTYSVTGSGKRPIYWLYDSGKQNGFKALIYLHRYNADTTGRVRANYLHRMEKVYESEIDRMAETIENSKNNREVVAAAKRREKLQRQLKECRDYDERIAHLALARIEIDLDDGVKVNYRKVQTDKNGKFYEILADSKNIMAKIK